MRATTKSGPETSQAAAAPETKGRTISPGLKAERKDHVAREQTRCPVCGGTGVSSGLVCEALSGRPQHFLRCPTCELQFDQNPENFEYEQGYYTDNPLLDPKLYIEKGSSLRLFTHLILQADRTLLLTRRATAEGDGKGRLWEAGCGLGLLLDLARFLGWETLGVEPAPEAARWGREMLGANIIDKPLRKKPPISNADVVIASEVIEHLESPWEFVEALSKSLGPDGVALLTTPNAKSKALAEQGSRWVHLGMGYHLVLYSPKAIEILLRKVGFRTIEIATFEGAHADERLIVLATKREIPRPALKAVSSFNYEEDREALELTIRYLWHVLRRFENEKNDYWRGAFFRLVEALVAAREYGQAIEVANQLERFLQSKGWTKESILETLDEATRAGDRRIFYAKVPTFVGNLYSLRGQARLHCAQLPAALDDLNFAYSVLTKLEQLPYKSYEELTAMPPSMHALFHIGYTHVKLGQIPEAVAALEKVLARRGGLPAEATAHARLNLAEAFQKLERHDEALQQFEQVVSLGAAGTLDGSLPSKAERKLLETRLALLQKDFQAEHVVRRSMESQLNQTQAELVVLRAALHKEQTARRAAEFELQQLRHRLVDALNNFIKRQAPGLHRWAKRMTQRTLRREYDSKKKSPPVKTAVSRRPSSRPIPQPTAPPIPRLRAPLAGCTIIAKNDLCKARVLAASFRQHHPDVPFFVLVVDPIEGWFDPEKESFYVVEATRLGIPQPTRFFFQYDLLEASTAVKPFFLAHLLRQHDIEKLIYLDSDILILNSLGRLSEELDRHSIVLTPHLTSPYEDGFLPGELEILRSGTFNLGFIALRNNPITHRMLSWWQQRLYDKCLMAPERGMHVDQKWIDLVPGLFGDVGVLRELGYNVAYWNLHERKVAVRDGQVRVNSEPAYFFHFSGFDPGDLDKVSIHQNRFRLDDLGDLRGLFERYRSLVTEAGWRETKGWPYGWGYFDNGVPIPRQARRLFWGLGGTAPTYENPFCTTETPSFLDWLNEGADDYPDPALCISRLWYEVYQSRPDLRQAYPDVMGTHRAAFVEWIRSRGRYEHEIDDQLVPCSREALLDQWTRPAVAPSPALGSQGEATERQDASFGVNIAGYANSEKGMGEAVRADIRNFVAAGIPCVVNNFADVHGSENTETIGASLSESNPYRINLVHVNADQVKVFAEQKNGYFTGRYNIGYWTWELSTFPDEWRESFGFFDEVWVPSRFVQDGVARLSVIPVVRVPHSINPRPTFDGRTTKAAFGLDADDFVFLFMFDFYSYAKRKNPLGLVEAFRRAFPEPKKVRLMIKCSHSDFDSAAFSELRAVCEGSNVLLLEAVLPRETLNSLMSLCDCYASLHRSEGFGLTLAEAMNLGKPVIATAYSGNMDFMTPANSFPVAYRLAEIETDCGPYRKGNVWAEPDLDHAAGLMRQVYENRESAVGVGLRARQYVQAELHPTVVGRLVRERLQQIGLQLGMSDQKPS